MDIQKIIDLFKQRQTATIKQVFEIQTNILASFFILSKSKNDKFNIGVIPIPSEVMKLEKRGILLFLKEVKTQIKEITGDEIICINFVSEAWRYKTPNVPNLDMDEVRKTVMPIEILLSAFSSETKNETIVYEIVRPDGSMSVNADGEIEGNVKLVELEKFDADQEADNIIKQLFSI